MRWLTWMALAAGLLIGFADAGVVRAQAGPAVSMTRMAASLKQGQAWGKINDGAFCVVSTPLTWDATDNAVSKDEVFVSLFRDELTAAGVQVADNPSDLFQSKQSNADLQVGALVTDLYMTICMWPDGTGSSGKGTARMDVEWQVFSTLQDRVVGRIRTHSEFVMSQFKNQPSTRLLTGVFAANAKALAASPDFRSLLTEAPAPATPKPGPMTPMIIAGRNAVVAMPLNQAAKDVVTIFAGNALGSGLMISPDGYILTNHHVAGEAGRVRVRWPDGTDTVGEVVRADRRRDVALIKTTPPKGLTSLAIRHTPVELGETVYAIGTPREREFAGTLTRGVVSTVTRQIEGLNYIQSDVAITHGNSGGPLLDEKGWVVGISQSTYEPGGVSQNINFFIPIDEALKALALAPVG